VFSSKAVTSFWRVCEASLRRREVNLFCHSWQWPSRENLRGEQSRRMNWIVWMVSWFWMLFSTSVYLGEFKEVEYRVFARLGMFVYKVVDSAYSPPDNMRAEVIDL
jgi:hypothetical protein